MAAAIGLTVAVGAAASGAELQPLPRRCDPTERGRKPTVKSQGSYGTCWALAATSALEAALLPKERLVFSADHLALNNAFQVPVDTGGDYLMTMAYLSGWQGPVPESEDPYGDAYSPDGLTPAVHVQEIRILDGSDETAVKRAVQQYGAVQTSLFMNRSTASPGSEFYNAWMSAYYDPEEQVQNHDIVILGWDDTVSRFCFRQPPERDGAWICQNSWGSEFGEDGIFYVSYADANIGSTALAYTKVEPVTNYTELYQTDDCGWQGSQGYGDADCWFANGYTARAEESLAAVGFYAVVPNTSYEVYLVRAGTAELSESQRTAQSDLAFLESAETSGSRTLLQSGVLEQAGFYTVKLDPEQPLAEGERFLVLVRVHAPGAQNPVAVEYRADAYTQNVATQDKFGYLSHDGRLWEHTEARYETNVCLKAYTRQKLR